MGQRRVMTVFITIAVVTTILSIPTQALPTPTTATVPDSTASNQTFAPESLGSSCMGASLDNNNLKMLLCAVRSKAETLSNAYNTSEGGNIGMNYPAFSKELVPELTSDEQCLLPFFRQMTRYSTLLQKTKNNVNRLFRRQQRRLITALRSLVKQLKSVCCESGTGNEGNATSCCSQMNQELPEVNVTGVTFDDNVLRNLTNSMYSLKSLDQCDHMDVKRSIRRNRKQGKRGKGGRRRKQGGKKSNSACATEAEAADVDTDATATMKEWGEKDRLTSAMRTLLASAFAILKEDPEASAGIEDVVNPTDALAAELDAGKSDAGDDLTTQTPERRRRTRKRCRGKGKKTRGRRCRGRKGRKQRGRKQRGRKNRGRKNRGGKKQRAMASRRRGSESRRDGDNNEE